MPSLTGASDFLSRSLSGVAISPCIPCPFHICPAGLEISVRYKNSTGWNQGKGRWKSTPFLALSSEATGNGAWHCQKSPHYFQESDICFSSPILICNNTELKRCIVLIGIPKVIGYHDMLTLLIWMQYYWIFICTFSLARVPQCGDSDNKPHSCTV